MTSRGSLMARAPLVVLPAANHPWQDYRLILDRFAPERRVFALDWPGFGASEKPDPADFAYSIQRYAEILAGWMDNLGIARAVLCGQFGGGRRGDPVCGGVSATRAGTSCSSRPLASRRRGSCAGPPHACWERQASCAQW